MLTNISITALLFDASAINFRPPCLYRFFRGRLVLLLQHFIRASSLGNLAALEAAPARRRAPTACVAASPNNHNSGQRKRSSLHRRPTRQRRFSCCGTRSLRESVASRRGSPCWAAPGMRRPPGALMGLRVAWRREKSAHCSLDAHGLDDVVDH